jgi:hypothetical protein
VSFAAALCTQVSNANLAKTTKKLTLEKQRLDALLVGVARLRQ